MALNDRGGCGRKRLDHRAPDQPTVIYETTA